MLSSARVTAQQNLPVPAGLLVADEQNELPQYESPEFELYPDDLSGRDRMETWLADHWSLEDLHIELLDTKGRPVRQQMIMNGNHLLLFTRRLAPGAYTIRLNDGKRRAADVLVVL
ncbi:hypothetical protein GGR28_000450 [Lewinella aquimaris]|uniref:Uncharacterized protein n=1 Tax=Neolewinella aquimaris TaxID=1835722 RepID=A0A840E7S3_9BACT|nr:hypothetical protein [Neolewinella aquimaris]MBB4077849.1 hypothetical protein [Neolewinella aquimaris]